MKLIILTPFLPALLVIGCSPDPTAFEEADFWCPGDPSGMCEADDDDTLRVGAAALAMTPTAFEQWNDLDHSESYQQGTDIFYDCGRDQLCPADDTYAGPDADGSENDGIYSLGEVYLDNNLNQIYDPGIDTFRDCGLDTICPAHAAYTAPDPDGTEGDGIFQSMWIAGFGTGRAANGHHDDLWARALYLEQGQTQIAIVAIDAVGLFYNDNLTIRQAARDQFGVDHVVMQSSHSHASPDTMGIWGSALLSSGIDPDYRQRVIDKSIEAIGLAIEAARPAKTGALIHQIPADAWDGRGINNFNIDTRDPAITDAYLRILQFTSQTDGSNIATIVNWPNHPETISSGNLLYSSDFAHYLRQGIESGIDTPDGHIDGAGGIAIYWQGACGGMQTPLRVTTRDVWGNDWRDSVWAKVEAVGTGIAKMALEALPNIEVVEDPVLRLRGKRYLTLVENTFYHIAINAELTDRPTFDWDPERPIADNNMPKIDTEVNIIDIGKVLLATVPGELLPEVWHGGYRDPYRNTGPLQTIIDPGNPNPPDLTQAPPPPYLIDHIDSTAPDIYPFLLGLANDEIGYIIPPFEFELGQPAYLFEAEGDHYEETNSVSPKMAPQLEQKLIDLLMFTPPAWE